MFDNLRIEVLEKGGYVAQSIHSSTGAYSPFVAAFTLKSELLKWLDINLESRSPDLVDRRPQAPVGIPRATKDTDDEIPF